MCFKVTSTTKHCIAKSDIVVYKTGEEENGVFTPPMYHKFKYVINQPTEKVKFDMINNSISRGYHTFDLHTAVMTIEHHDKNNRGKVYQRADGSLKRLNMVVGKFVIPAGTEYYQNILSYKTKKSCVVTFVSTQLIYKGLI